MNLSRHVIFPTATALVFAVAVFSSAQAGEGPAAGNVGVGLMLGSPTGLSAKYWLDQKTAVDTDIGWGWGGGTTFVADYLWHDFSAFSFIKDPATDGKLAFVVGAGARVQTDGNDPFGLRAVFGLSYFFPRNPFELYAEIVPVLVLVDHPDGDLDGGVGFRYYFR